MYSLPDTIQNVFGFCIYITCGIHDVCMHMCVCVYIYIYIYIYICVFVCYVCLYECVCLHIIYHEE